MKDPMHVLIVPDSFKGTMSATQVADIMHRAVKNVFPLAICTVFPFSDAGEGALAVLENVCSGKTVRCPTVNSLGEPIEAPYYLFEDGKSAWIELSQASGLAQLTKEQRNPLHTSTYGTGLLIRAALEQGCQNIYLGIGGSSTHDLATGIFSALGGRLFNHNGLLLEPCGASLSAVSSIDFDRVLPSALNARLVVACDVDNTLIGPTGSAHTYAQQKGASDEDILRLEMGSTHFANLIKQQSGREVTQVIGGGAAGGVAAGLSGLFNAKIENGFDILYRLTPLEEHIKKADLVFTGEGQFDAQSIRGKLPFRIAKATHELEILTYIVAGQVSETTLPQFPRVYIERVKPDHLSLEEALDCAPMLLERKMTELLMHLNY